jgi:hypothetical protein
MFKLWTSVKALDDCKQQQPEYILLAADQKNKYFHQFST